jgi:hypothetical protein
MFAELAFASWQTITHRFSMMVLGPCSAAEYQKMLTEKMLAGQKSLVATLNPRLRNNAPVAPWKRAASANAKRLSRRKRR